MSTIYTWTPTQGDQLREGWFRGWFRAGSQSVQEILEQQARAETLHNLEQIFMFGVDKREVQRASISAVNYPHLLSNYIETETVIEPTAGPGFLGEEQPQ